MKQWMQAQRAAQQYALRKVIATGLRASFKMAGQLPLPLKLLRESMDRSSMVFPVRNDVRAKPARLGGVPGLRIEPAQYVGERVVLHLHGGAFFGGSSASHQGLCSELAARAQCPVLVVDYRLAPECPYPAALDDGLAAYQALLAEGYSGEQIVLCGDSAGGALILALALELKARQLAMPGGLVMLSPFLDMTLSSPSVSHLAHHDPMLSKQVLERGAVAYRGNIPANDPRVSPVFADLKGLPPTLVQCGSEEVLLDDALLFRKLAGDAGVDVRCKVYEGMWHNFQMFNHLLDVSNTALDEIAEFIRTGR